MLKLRLHFIWFEEQLHVAFARRMQFPPSVVTVMLGPQVVQRGLPFSLSKPIVLLNLSHVHRKPSREKRACKLNNKYIITARKFMNLRFAAGSRFLLASHREQDKETVSKYSSYLHELGSQYSSTSLFTLKAFANVEKMIAINTK